MSTEKRNKLDIFKLTHFISIFPLYTPLKTWENQRFSDVFRGIQRFLNLEYIQHVYLFTYLTLFRFFIVTFEPIWHIFLLFLLFDFEQVNVCWLDGSEHLKIHKSDNSLEQFKGNLVLSYYHRLWICFYL